MASNKIQMQPGINGGFMAHTMCRPISTYKKIDIETDLDELDLVREDQEKLVENPWTMLPFKQESLL